MNKYTRYFKVTDGPLIDAIKASRETNKAAEQEYRNILKDVNNGQGYYQRNKKLVAIQFATVPDRKVFKKAWDGWYPKQTTKEGKALHLKLKAVVTSNEDDHLSLVGLKGHTIITGRYLCQPTLNIIPSSPIVAFVGVPWYDEDPEKLAEYVNDPDTGCSNMDSLLWKPTAHMEEVKEWEVQKAFDEWNTHVKEVNAKKEEEASHV